MKHATEWGLGLCAGLRGNSKLKAAGLRMDTRACDGKRITKRDYNDKNVVISFSLPYRAPDCPECSVLRDMALDGKLGRGTPPAPSPAHGPSDEADAGRSAVPGSAAER